ncbi:MAG: hypothetical protein H0V19_00980 [Euzebyales bacterium]|nr:hypothetical protein [Euzebyales bacterium]
MTTPPGLADGTRWRCGACGNLTRFDVESAERVRRFFHFDLSGAASVEEEEEEEEERSDVIVESVTCRWCGSREAVEVVAAPGGARAGGA